MASEARLLTIQFLRWVTERPRRYDEVRDAWGSTCPLNCAWEDAIADDLVRRTVDARIVLTEHGRARLDAAALLEPVGGVSYRPAARPQVQEENPRERHRSRQP